MNGLLSDLRYALRGLRKAPGFMVTALVTIAICLGANLAIFAVIDAILLRPLPFPESDRLVTIFNTYPKVPCLICRSSTRSSAAVQKRGSFRCCRRWASASPPTACCRAAC